MDKKVGNAEGIEILNHPQVEELVDRLTAKLKEAREIANQLASTEIIIKDATRKEIHEYEEMLKKEFKNQFGLHPERIVLQAAAGINTLCISLKDI